MSKAILYLGIGGIFAAAIGQYRAGWNAVEFVGRAMFTVALVLAVAGLLYGAYRLTNRNS